MECLVELFLFGSHFLIGFVVSITFEYSSFTRKISTKSNIGFISPKISEHFLCSIYSVILA